MSANEDSKRVTEWWGVFDWDVLVAAFVEKDDARRWMAWNNPVHDRLCIRKVRSLFVEDARMAAEGA